MDALQSFKKTVQRHGLFDKSNKLLIAVSGGSDSTALCYICDELGYNIGIAHINYQLRGKDSYDDAKLVESTAEGLSVPFYEKTIDCKKHAEDHQLSIQVSARNIRYNFFDSIMAMYDYDYLLTAHHAKDNVETMLYTLAKGASLKGLRGIPLSRKNIRRPLLHTNKSAIDLYLRKNDINHRHDISNDDTKYKRNYIRHEILPRLEQINPNLESTLLNTSMLGTGYQHLLEEMLADQKKLFQETKKLDLSLKTTQPSRFAWLYEIIHPSGFNFNDVLEIWSTMDQRHSTGRTFQAGGNQLTINRGYLILNDISEDEDYKFIKIDGIESASDDSKGRVRINKMDHLPSENGAYFDASIVTFPLTIRRWKAGDRFRPSGMEGKSKKVKDYLTDQQVSGPARREAEVMLSQDEIIWVVGFRMAEGYKANRDTQSIISISVK